MKIFIKHRVNSLAQVTELEEGLGAEIDIRSNVNKADSLHLAHDPWTLGDSFEEWIKVFSKKKNRGPLLLNTKEDGLENRVLDILASYQITDFFFLDTTLPTLIRWTQKEKKNFFSIRHSMYEDLALIKPFAGQGMLLWIDCFQGLPVDANSLRPLKSEFTFCLVSPELQSKDLNHLDAFSNLYELTDMVCTKDPSLWINRFEKK